MPEFVYQARDSAGSRTEGSLNAASKAVAMDQLSNKGLFVTRIAEEKADEEKAPGRRLLPFLPAVSSNEVVVMIRRLATLVSAGIPLVEALKALSKQVESPVFRHVLREVTEDVQRGQPLSRAMSRHKNVFPEIMVSMVMVGETGGILGQVLDQLADFSERDREIRGEVLGAMAYPILVLTLAAATVTFLMLTIVPKITLMFSGSKALLPVPTLVLMAASDFMQRFGLIILAAIILGAGGFVFYLRSPEGRAVFDRVKLRIPVLGGLVRRTAIARFARCLGALVTGGVPLMEALDVVKRVLHSPAMTQAIERMQERVRKGDPMARGLEDETLFPEMVRYMISAGEESGHLDAMLYKVAEIYEMETRNAIKVVLGLLSPLLLLLVAVVVGFIALSILLPIFRMSQTMR